MKDYFGLNSPSVNAACNIIVVVALLLVTGRGLATNRHVQTWLRSRDIRALTEQEWKTATQRASVLGPNPGTVDVVLFADYQCPFCRRQHEELERFRGSHPEVRLGVVQMPLSSIHPTAAAASRAALCAAHQHRFREMHELLYRDTTWYGGDGWRELAVIAGVESPDTFDECLEGLEVGSQINDDLDLARAWRINSTPTLVTRRGVYPGAGGTEGLWQEFGRRP